MAIVLIISFISILNFLITVEFTHSELFLRQFRQNNNDLRNLSHFIKSNISNDKIKFLKKLNLKNKYSKNENNKVKYQRSSTDIYHISQ